MANLYFRVTISSLGVSYDLSEDLTSLTVEEDDQLADKLTVLVPDPFKVFSFALQEGMDVEVDLGYADNHSVIFRGLTTQVQAEFPEDAVPQVTLTAMDNSIRMGLKKRNRPWTNTDLQGIVAAIALDHQFFRQDISLPAGGNPSFTGNGIRQQEETDLAFLHKLATDQHCKVFVEVTDTGDIFTFKAEQLLMDANPAATISYGYCGVAQRLLSFSTTSDLTQRRRPQVYASVDPTTGQEINSERHLEEARNAPGNPYDENLAALARRFPVKAAALGGLLSAAPAAAADFLAAMGASDREIITGLYDSQTLREQTAPPASTVFEGITGQGVTEGNKDMRAKRNIEIEGAGGRFSGKWYLSQVRHVVDASGYRTHFTCSR